MGLGFESPGEVWDVLACVSAGMFILTSGIFDIAAWWYPRICDAWWVGGLLKWGGARKLALWYDRNYFEETTEYWQRAMGWMGFLCSVMFGWYGVLVWTGGEIEDYVHLGVIAVCGIVMFAEMQQFVHNIMTYDSGGWNMAAPFFDMVPHMVYAVVIFIHSSYPVMKNTTVWGGNGMVWVWFDPFFLVLFAFTPMITMGWKRVKKQKRGAKRGPGDPGDVEMGSLGKRVNRIFRWAV